MNNHIVRAKRLDNGEWVEGYYVPDTNEKFGYIIGKVVDACEEYFGPEWWYPVDPDTVCSCTGLEDNNSQQLIFENDICNAIAGMSSTKGVIRWGNYGWLLDGDDGHKYFLHNIVRDCSVKVIGNTIDNPELLEGQ